MQLLFLFCTMLIVISEAFSQKLTTASRSTSFKRKTSRFPYRLRNPFSRYMLSDLNVPLTSDYEISQYEAPKFTPLNRYGIKPYKYNRKYFTGEDNVDRRNFLKNNLHSFTERFFNLPQSFESYQFPRSGFHHFRKFNGLRKVRGDNVKIRKHECAPRAGDSFNRKNPTHGVGKLITSLKKKHKRFSNYKRQCVSDGDNETQKDEFKANATDVSGSDEETIDNFRGEKLEFDSPQDYSVFGKPNSLISRENSPTTFKAHKFEHPDDPKLFDLSSFENDNLAPGVGKKDAVEMDDESRNSFKDNIGDDISKLKSMIVDLEKTIKENQREPLLVSKDEKTSLKEKSGGERIPLSSEKKIASQSSTIATPTKLLSTIPSAGPNGMSSATSSAMPTVMITQTSRSTTPGESTEAVESTSKKPTERCNVDGTWSSTTMKMDLIFTMQPNMMIKVKVKPFEDSEINEKWSLQGLSLSKRGGPYIFAGLYPQKKSIVTFLGQCKISKEDDFIFGIWTLFHYSRKYTDLWKSVETKLDVLAKKDSTSEKKKAKEKKAKKKKEEKKT